MKVHHTSLFFLFLLLTIISCGNTELQDLIDDEDVKLKKALDQSGNQQNALSEASDSTMPVHIQDHIKLGEHKILQSISASEASAHIPNGFQIVQSEKGPNLVSGYLNDDENLDFAALVVKREDLTEYSESDEVYVLIFEGTNTKRFVKKAQSGNLSSAFIYNNTDRPKLTLVNNKVLKLSHQSMRHHYDLKFRYESDKRDYVLIASDYDNYGNAMKQGAGVISTNFNSGKRTEKLMNYDEDTEVVFLLPEKIIEFSAPLIPIGQVSDDTIYELIGGK